ncbi:thiamine biosynthesis protein ThiS [Leptolyngbya valderiana BDU 20041]|nr:thiamine biosynthesis protein ThiS [Leptolyngbya valderiana BDU 20041]
MPASALMSEISVTVNGEARTAPAGLSLYGFLDHLGLDPRKVAVERNLEIAPRSQYDAIRIEPDDRLEIVHFVGGG